MVQFAFNAQTVIPDEGGGFGVWPDGPHTVQVVRSDWKATNDNQGTYLECVIQGLAGQVQGKENVLRFNLKNNSEKAVEIAYKQLSALMHAVGVFNIADTSQLHNRPFQVTAVSEDRTIKDQRTGADRVVKSQNFRDFKTASGMSAMDVHKQLTGQAGAAPGGAPPPPPPMQQQPQQTQQPPAGFAQAPQPPQGGFAPPPQGGFAPPPQQMQQPQQGYAPQPDPNQQQFQQPPQQQFNAPPAQQQQNPPPGFAGAPTQAAQPPGMPQGNWQPGQGAPANWSPPPR